MLMIPIPPSSRQSLIRPMGIVQTPDVARYFIPFLLPTLCHGHENREDRWQSKRKEKETSVFAIAGCIWLILTRLGLTVSPETGKTHPPFVPPM